MFGYRLPPALLREVTLHAEQAYPASVCGFILGPEEADHLTRVQPLPTEACFPPKNSEDQRVLREAKAAGLLPRVIYHSHCDASASLSPEDHAMLVQSQGAELPNYEQLIVSVRDGKLDDMAGYRYDAGRDAFFELRDVPDTADLILPELRVRAVFPEGRLIPPVGGSLCVCRIAANERAKFQSMAEGRQLCLRESEQRQDFDRLARGYYSPLPGYLREAELRSMRARGRLPEGTPWRYPVVLEVLKRDAQDLEASQVVELVDPDGLGLGLLAITERRKAEDGKIALAGPVYAYPSLVGQDALQVRATLLQKQAKRVLAVPPRLEPVAARADLSEFDVVLAAGELTGALDLLGSVAGATGWIQAAMAQNLGATHICLPGDASLRRAIRDSLEIEPWPSYERQNWG